MTSYRITCTTKSRCPKGHHIVTVGIENLPRLTVPEVYQKMDAGDTFYTLGDGKIAAVAKDKCGCRVDTLRSRVDTLRSRADAVLANNLDNLPACR
jgi:hypothetical protein